MQVSRGIETAIEEGIEEMVVDKYRYRGGVKEQSIKCKNKSSIYPPGIEKLLRLCYEKKLKELDRQLAIEEVSSQLFKTIFGEEKNTDMNAIKHATQPTIQSTY